MAEPLSAMEVQIREAQEARDAFMQEKETLLVKVTELEGRLATNTPLPQDHVVATPSTTPGPAMASNPSAASDTPAPEGVNIPVASTARDSLEPKVATPDHFSGARAKLETFLTQVNLVMHLQPRRFASENFKVIYNNNNKANNNINRKKDDSRQKNGKLTPDEYTRRKDAGLCLYCGSDKHKVDKCDSKKSKDKPTTRGNVALTAPIEDSGKDNTPKASA
ncbi:hypothetical protein TREMEDRAFT_61975 [Tremella mesenterica DSM 1558]|uniref:uncharacterized protein n=1 Tax=Tremella mesenterica (strain ATCC 24925 / CBS 8224 / DSM 1558 / NBRC 9311 / NRRL Y-6157 / RJB 2259-6 / UBC 559-6) TaxID=578456 RepID=UPI0003F4A48B|nr:uncharacterized protein TREMEDRAFT_61975 [Tremella mesenterica DSM 1558]EIW70214.1 hypothetical protein TREMEDRAFT_61975 [Tremella mesenterica DSM 1558]